MSSVFAVVQSVGAKVLIIGINALTGIITARALRPEGRGELAAMILWPVFLASALSLGVPSALTFQLKRNPGKQSQLMGDAFCWRFWPAVRPRCLACCSCRPGFHNISRG